VQSCVIALVAIAGAVVAGHEVVAIRSVATETWGRLRSRPLGRQRRRLWSRRWCHNHGGGRSADHGQFAPAPFTRPLLDILLLDLLHDLCSLVIPKPLAPASGPQLFILLQAVIENWNGLANLRLLHQRTVAVAVPLAISLACRRRSVELADVP